MKSLVLKYFKKVMNVCPKWLQDEVVRKTINLPKEVPSNFTFKIAETEEELEAAFRLVYDAYLKLGYCSENPYKMRATIYHALSTTATVIATDNGKVIGTLTIVRDNVLKLPVDTIFDVSSMRAKAQRLAEVTSLVIHPDYRREKGGCVLFTMLRFMHEYSTNYFGVDHLVVTVHPKDAFFYKSLLLFKTIPGTGVVDYLGAPAVALSLDLKKAFVDFQEVYNPRSDAENLFKYFITRKIPNLQFPKKHYNKINYPVVSVSYFIDLFVNKLGIGDEFLKEKEFTFSGSQFSKQREFQRIEVELPAFLKVEGSRVEICGRVKDVSKNGFKFFTEHTLPVGEEFECEIYITNHVTSHVKAKAVWSHENHGVGFSISEHDAKWEEFIEYLYKEQQGKIA